MKRNVLLEIFVILFCRFDICNAQLTKTDSLLSLLKSAKEDTNKVNILFQLADISVEDSEIINYSKRALQLSEKLNFSQGIADAYINIGYVNSQKGEIALALAYYTRSLEIMEKNGDKSSLAPLLNNIAAVYERQGAISTALEYYQKSLKIREQLGDKNGIAKLLNNIALLYKSQGDFANAHEYLQRCLKIMEGMNDKSGIAMSLINIGFIYQGQGKLAESIKYFEKSSDIYKEIGYSKGFASALYNIGMNYSLQGNYDKALVYYEESLKVMEDNGDKIIIAACMNNIGKIYFEKNNYLMAEEFCLKSLGIAKDIGIPERISYASEALSKIYSKENNYKQAYEMQVLFKQMADSINNQETRKATVKKQMQYEFDKKETETKAAQEKKDALANAEIKRQRVIRNSTFGGVGIAGIFSFLLVRSFNRRKKTDFENQVSQVEMKALRAQMNPHFIFNSLNSIHSFIQQNKGEKASDYLIKFSRLMRLILENSNYEEVALESDLEALGLYMELEAARMNNKFSFSIDVDDSIDKENTLVPPLILQPFVENSIWHGMMHKEQNGLIQVTISKSGDMIKCIVQDNGVGREKAKELKSDTQKGKHESLGMKITNERIEIINRIKKSEAFVVLKDLYDESKNSLGTLVEVQLPLEKGF